MKKWHMVVDIARCQDCNNCFLACKDEYFENDFLPYSVAQPRHGHRWMDILRCERGVFPKVEVAYLPFMCMHCNEPACIEGSPPGHVYKREDGIVIIDPVKAEGNKQVIEACPYGVIYWNEEKGVPQKCTFCVHLLEQDGWEKPRCVQACPTGALSALHVKEEDMILLVESEDLEVYQPQLHTKPSVYYKNLYKFTKCFIAGSIACKDNNECFEGAQVVLSTEGSLNDMVTTTNNYGDFKFDNLKENLTCRIEISYPGRESLIREVETKTSINLGTLYL